MSEPNDDLLKAIADLMQEGQDSQASAGESTEAPDEPPAEDFLARLAACERAVNA